VAGVSGAEAPRWRRLEADARREQILDAAVRLFGDRPYSAVSTTELAAAAGVTRGLLHHYFGTKRDLYVEVVRRLVLRPEIDSAALVGESLEERVDSAVNWFLDTVVGTHGKTFVAIMGAEGVGDDPEIESILAEADDVAARKVLQTLALRLSGRDAVPRAAIRAYGGLVKAAVREWVRDGTLTRDQVHRLLSATLSAIVRDVLPALEPRP
jgi:AcrR family transcriptional regulator